MIRIYPKLLRYASCYNPSNKADINDELVELVNKDQNGLKIAFILDSAATINTVANINCFYSYKEMNTTVNWGKANSLKEKYQGDILIK